MAAVAADTDYDSPVLHGLQSVHPVFFELRMVHQNLEDEKNSSEFFDSGI